MDKVLISGDKGCGMLDFEVMGSVGKEVNSSAFMPVGDMVVGYL